MIQVNVHEAKSRLSELLVAAQNGDEVIIARAGKPQARLVPINSDNERAIRAAKMQAYIGSGRGLYPPEAMTAFLEPAFTEEELDAFDAPFAD